MNDAAIFLLESDESDERSAGLNFLKWEADEYPDMSRVRDISELAQREAYKDDGAPEDVFKIALTHMRKTADKDPDSIVDQRPTDFFDELGSVLSNISSLKLKDLRQNAVSEFAPLTIKAAENYTRDSSLADSDVDWDKRSIDGVLLHITRALKEKEPDIAKLAHSLITDELTLMLRKEDDFSDAFGVALNENDLSTIKDLLSEGDLGRERIWTHLLKKLMSQSYLDSRDDSDSTQKSDEETVNEVLDMYVEVRGEQLKIDGEYTDTTVDHFYGKKAGFVLGRLDRQDIIEILVNPEVKHSDNIIFVTGISYGLGQKANIDGLKKLLTRLPKYNYDAREKVFGYFIEGLNHPHTVPE